MSNEHNVRYVDISNKSPLICGEVKKKKEKDRDNRSLSYQNSTVGGDGDCEKTRGGEL